MLTNKTGSTTRLGGVYIRLESEEVIVILKYINMKMIKEYKIKTKTHLIRAVAEIVVKAGNNPSGLF